MMDIYTAQQISHPIVVIVAGWLAEAFITLIVIPIVVLLVLVATVILIKWIKNK